MDYRPLPYPIYDRDITPLPTILLMFFSYSDLHFFYNGTSSSHRQ